MSNNCPPEKCFYKVAFSYASENREYVTEVYKHLVSLVEENKVCKKEKIFFDVPSFKQGRVRASEPLKTIYSEQSEFIVPFHCKKYLEKKWTQLEHSEIIFFLDNGEQECIIPVRFDDTEIKGFNKFTDSYIDVKNNQSDYKEAKEVAEDIFERIKDPTNRGKQLSRREIWEAKGISYLSIQKLFQSVDDLIEDEEDIQRQEEIRKLCPVIISQKYLDHFPQLENITYRSTLDWFADLANLADSDSYKYLLMYVNLFLKNIRIKQETYNQIDSWLEDCCTIRLCIKREDLEPKTIIKNIGKIYLLIKFIKTDEENLYKIDLYKNNVNGKIERLLTPENLEEVNIENTDSKKIFTENLSEFLGQLGDEQDIDIELEFIVPYHLFWCDFEQWEIEDGEFLGHVYPVVVRPAQEERKSKKRYKARWKMINKTNFLETQIKYLKQEIKPELKKWQKELNQFISQAYTDKTCSAVAIGSPIKPNCPSIKIRGGVPIIMWARKSAKEGVSKEFLTNNNITNKMLEELPTAIREIRLEGMTRHPKDLMNNFVLLLDDKERQPPQQQLQSPYIEE